MLAEHALKTTTSQADQAAERLGLLRRAYGLDDDRPAKHGRGRTARDGRAAAPTTPPTEGPADSQRGSAEHRRYREEGRRWPADRQPPIGARSAAHRVESGWLLGAEPRRDHPGRRRDWQQLRAALERLADHHRRGREDRDRPQERAGRPHSRDIGYQERDGR